MFNKIKRYIKRVRRRFMKKKENTKPFFENPSELVFTPFVKTDDNTSKLTGDSKAFMGGRFKSGY